MIAVRNAGSGYLIRIRTRQGVKLLGPYPTVEEAEAVRKDYMRQVIKGREG